METLPDTAPLALTAVHAALKAGELLRRGFGTDFSYSTKKSESDYVTEYDYASEGLILELIRSQFPDHNFLAEESGSKQVDPEKVTWIIDPIDGTTNFIRNIPLFSISIGVVLKETVLAGVIYNPITHELFVAEKGKGSFLNGKRITVSTQKNLKLCTFVTGFPYDMGNEESVCLSTLNTVLHQGIRVRDLGSCAIDMAYVAAGRLDAFWLINPSPWDVAAGLLLIEEAGGTVSFLDGSPFNVYEPKNILTTNGLIHEELLSIWKTAST